MNFSEDGVEKSWELAQVHDSVAVLIVDEKRQKFILVKQFRPAIFLNNNDGYTHELCAGIIDKKLSDPDIAIAEVYEETGYRVDPSRLKKITSFHTAVGFAGSKQTLFIAYVDEKDKISQGGGIDTEKIEIVELDIKDAHDFMFDEQIVKTPGVLFAFLWYFGNH